MADKEYVDIVFLQNSQDFDDFTDPSTKETGIDAFFDAGKDDMFDYLYQWEMGDRGEVRDEEPWGTNDKRYEKKVGDDEYVMAYNSGLGYAGLTRIEDKVEDMKFASQNEALQHLADITGKTIKIAAEGDWKQDLVLLKNQYGKLQEVQDHASYLKDYLQEVEFGEEQEEKKRKSTLISLKDIVRGLEKALVGLSSLDSMRVLTSAVEGKDNQKFVDSYIETMLWSSVDDSEENDAEYLDQSYGPEDIAPEFMTQIKKDCIQFIKENYPFIEVDMRTAGHDFWLTRVGHGAGFWDGNWEFNVDGENAGKHLTEASKKFGEVTPYVGDDGKIYGA